MFLTKKWCGRIKAQGYADGRKQCETTSKEEASSPTVTIESVMLTSVIDAMEGHHIGTLDIPGASFHAGWYRWRRVCQIRRQDSQNAGEAGSEVTLEVHEGGAWKACSHVSKKQGIYSATSNWLIITPTTSNHYRTKLQPYLPTTILNWMFDMPDICTRTYHLRVWRLSLPTTASNSTTLIYLTITLNYHSATLLCHPPTTVLNSSSKYQLTTHYNISYIVSATGLVHTSENRSIDASMTQMTLNHPTTLQPLIPTIFHSKNSACLICVTKYELPLGRLRPPLRPTISNSTTRNYPTITLN